MGLGDLRAGSVNTDARRQREAELVFTLWTWLTLLAVVGSYLLTWLFLLALAWFQN